MLRFNIISIHPIGNSIAQKDIEAITQIVQGKEAQGYELIKRESDLISSVHESLDYDNQYKNQFYIEIKNTKEQKFFLIHLPEIKGTMHYMVHSPNTNLKTGDLFSFGKAWYEVIKVTPTFEISKQMYSEKDLKLRLELSEIEFIENTEELKKIVDTEKEARRAIAISVLKKAGINYGA